MNGLTNKIVYLLFFKLESVLSEISVFSQILLHYNIIIDFILVMRNPRAKVAESPDIKPLVGYVHKSISE